VPIYLRYTVNGRRTEVSISKRIDPVKWNAKTGRMRGSGMEAIAFNQYLDTIRNKVNKVHQRLVEEE